MLDYLVLYQSESGNTKKIAASIFSRRPGNSKDLIDIDTDKIIPEAKIYFVGFCVHRGSCSMEVSDFLSDLSGKQIVMRPSGNQHNDQGAPDREFSKGVYPVSSIHKTTNSIHFSLRINIAI